LFSIPLLSASPFDFAHYEPIPGGARWHWESPYWLEQEAGLVFENVTLEQPVELVLDSGSQRRRVPLPAGVFKRISLPMGLPMIKELQVLGQDRLPQPGVESLSGQGITFSLDPEISRIDIKVQKGINREFSLSEGILYEVQGRGKPEPFYLLNYGSDLTFGDTQGVLSMVPGIPETPVPRLDAGQMLLPESRDLWLSPDYGLFEWSVYDGVYVFMFRNYAVQARFLKRLAFFVEKKGYVGQLMDNLFLADKHGYNAHNYLSRDLAAFFQKAREQGFVLNGEEEELLQWLLDLGIIIQWGDTFVPGEGAVLSASMESWDYLRFKLLTHELIHGLYFLDKPLEDFARTRWEALDEDQQRFWRLFLDWYRYDVSNPYLVVNEFTAYLMQQPPEEARDYLGGLMVSRIISSRPGEKDFLYRFLKDYPSTFLDNSRILEDYFIQNFGLRAGELRKIIKK